MTPLTAFFRMYLSTPFLVLTAVGMLMTSSMSLWSKEGLTRLQAHGHTHFVKAHQQQFGQAQVQVEVVIQLRGEVSQAFPRTAGEMGCKASHELALANFFRSRGDSTRCFCKSLNTSAPPQKTGRFDRALRINSLMTLAIVWKPRGPLPPRAGPQVPVFGQSPEGEPCR